MKYYVVADVHGFFDEMVKALTEQGYFTDKQPHKLIICGDLFDRGTQNKEVEEFVLGLIEKDEIILIRGNHEDLITECVDKLPTYALMGTHSHHYTNGAINTIIDLTGCTFDEMRTAPEQTAAKMKQTGFYQKILPAMKNYYETQNYIFVH